MVKIFINDNPVEVNSDATILDAAQKAGIDIPHLCYHQAFPPEGSCRMCLVEIEGAPKLELACSTPVRDGMKVYTHTGEVCEARKGVLEFLLANHPNDCPICEQSGDCKLQDYYDEYGLFDSRFSENKIRREKKVTLGKNLLLDRERCILCTRCVRFLKNITGGEELGVFQRGSEAEIALFPGETLDNNYSGNLAEICPVGAITDLDFRFKSRTWFMESAPSLCPLCSRGCNIYIDHHPGYAKFEIPKRIYRIKARENPDVNGYWICDKGRYGYGYIDKDRLKTTEVNGQNVDYLEGLTLLTEAIQKLRHKNKTHRISMLLNSFLSNEELYLIDKIFIKELGVKQIRFIDPPEEQGDEILLTSERAPNRRGAREIGFDVNLQEMSWTGTELLLIFEGPMPVESLNKMISSLPDKVEDRFLFTPRKTELGNNVSAVFPTAVTAEKMGSLTNQEGKVQPFLAVLDPPGTARPEWEWLKYLGKELGIDFPFHSRIFSPRDIFTAMQGDISFFQVQK